MSRLHRFTPIRSIGGQAWTTLAALGDGYRNLIRQEEPGLFAIHTEPHFAIGQRALLLQTPQGNLLWDCVTLLDQSTFDAVRGLGGIAAIAFSSALLHDDRVEPGVWRRAHSPHEADRRWVMRPDPGVHFWSGETLDLFADLMLIHTPGHFDGFQVLHWPAGADGRGTLLCGDQPQVCADTRWVSFIYSYPNFIPLGARAVTDIVGRLAPFAFDRVYGAFPDRTVMTGGKAAIERSAERYLQAIDSAAPTARSSAPPRSPSPA